jgi:hypothetical protein
MNQKTKNHVRYYYPVARLLGGWKVGLNRLMNIYNVMVHSFFILESSKKNEIEYESENEKSRSILLPRSQITRRIEGRS